VVLLAECQYFAGKHPEQLIKKTHCNVLSLSRLWPAVLMQIHKQRAEMKMKFMVLRAEIIAVAAASVTLSLISINQYFFSSSNLRPIGRLFTFYENN
jgi:hypothetical protein